MAAQLEEVVVHGDFVEAEHVGPDRGQHLLGERARREVVVASSAVRSGSGKRLAVDLAVRREGHPLQRDECGRDHVVGEPLRDEGAQLARPELSLRDVVGDETSVARAVFARHDDYLADGVVPQEGRFDFAQLDAEAAHLHLVVEPAEELHAAVGKPAHPIACAVEPRRGLLAEGIGDESLGGERRASQVASSDAFPAHVQLAGYALGHRFLLLVEDVEAGVGEGLSDRRRPSGVVSDVVQGGNDRRFRRAVGVPEAPSWRPARRKLARARLAAHYQRVHSRQPFDGKRAEERRREERGGGSVALDRVRELFRGEQGLARHQLERGALRERRRHLPHRGVEAERGHLQHPMRRIDPEPRRAGRREVAEPAMRVQRRLGAAGGTGGVDDVGQIPGPARARQGPGGKGAEILVERDHACAAPGEALFEVALGEEDLDPGVLDQEGEALARVARVEREVGAAGREDGQHPDDHVERPFGAETDRALRADAKALQAAGEAMDAGREVAVGEALVLEEHRGRAGPPIGLVFEEVHHGRLARVPGGAVIPIDEQLPALLRREHLQRADGPQRVFDRALEQVREVARHPLDGSALEEVGVELHRAVDLVADLGRLEREIELGGGALAGDRTEA